MKNKLIKVCFCLLLTIQVIAQDEEKIPVLPDNIALKAVLKLDKKTYKVGDSIIAEVELINESNSEVPIYSYIYADMLEIKDPQNKPIVCNVKFKRLRYTPGVPRIILKPGETMKSESVSIPVYDYDMFQSGTYQIQWVDRIVVSSPPLDKPSKIPFREMDVASNTLSIEIQFDAGLINTWVEDLKSKDEVVRRKAAYLLWKSQDSRCLDGLVFGLSSEDPIVRLYVRRGLEEVFGAIEPPEWISCFVKQEVNVLGIFERKLDKPQIPLVDFLTKQGKHSILSYSFVPSKHYPKNYHHQAQHAPFVTSCVALVIYSPAQDAINAFKAIKEKHSELLEESEIAEENPGFLSIRIPEQKSRKFLRVRLHKNTVYLIYVPNYHGKPVEALDPVIHGLNDPSFRQPQNTLITLSRAIDSKDWKEAERCFNYESIQLWGEWIRSGEFFVSKHEPSSPWRLEDSYEITDLKIDDNRSSIRVSKVSQQYAHEHPDEVYWEATIKMEKDYDGWKILYIEPNRKTKESTVKSFWIAAKYQDKEAAQRCVDVNKLSQGRHEISLDKALEQHHDWVKKFCLNIDWLNFALKWNNTQSGIRVAGYNFSYDYDLEKIGDNWLIVGMHP